MKVITQLIAIFLGGEGEGERNYTLVGDIEKDPIKVKF